MQLPVLGPLAHCTDTLDIISLGGRELFALNKLDERSENVIILKLGHIFTLSDTWPEPVLDNAREPDAHGARRKTTLTSVLG